MASSSDPSKPQAAALSGSQSLQSCPIARDDPALDTAGEALLSDPSSNPAPVPAGVLEAFPVMPNPWPIIPGRQERHWMEAYPQRHAYRCLPLNMANTSGWEILCPTAITAIWNGGPLASDISVIADDPAFSVPHLASGHFAHGILTFHVSYLFRTAPGTRLWIGGPPNWPKDGIYPLQGIVESDWLPFPFTMNWHFTRPNHPVRFEPYEPICFLTLIDDAPLEATQPILRYMSEEPALLRQYESWRASRTDFNAKLDARDEGAIKAGWQRHYFRGERDDDPSIKAVRHVTKRRLKELVRVIAPNDPDALQTDGPQSKGLKENRQARRAKRERSKRR